MACGLPYAVVAVPVRKGTLSTHAPTHAQVGVLAHTHGLTTQQAPSPQMARALSIDPALSTHGSPAICGRARVHWVASHPVSYLWSTTTRSGWQVDCSCGRPVGLPCGTWQQAMARAHAWSVRCHTETTSAHDTSLTITTTNGASVHMRTAMPSHMGA
jgi:hypothetical protein